MADRSINWDNVNTIVHDYIAPHVQDAIFTSQVTYMTLEANNRVILRGGDSISWPVAMAKLKSGSYRGASQFPSQEVQTKRRAVLEWKQLFVDIVVSNYDAKRAQGPLATLDLVDELRQEATLAAVDTAGTQIYGDGSGNGSLDLDGARNGFDDGTLYATYAGLSRAGNTWWQGNVNSTGGNLTLSAMNSSYSSATVGNAHPNLITTTQTLWNRMWDRVQPQQRYEAGDERNRLARVGFDSIRFNGADVAHEDDGGVLPSGNIFYWNTDYIELRVEPNTMWSWTGWKVPYQADAQQGQILFMGNMLTLQPRLVARDTGVT